MTPARAKLEEQFQGLRESAEDALQEVFRDGVGQHCCSKPHMPVAHQLSFLDSKGRRGSCAGPFARMDEDTLELLAMLYRLGFQPETVVYEFDGYAPTGLVNPKTGIPWSLQDVYAEGSTEGSGLRGLVSDAVIVEMFDLNTKTHLGKALPYRISPDDGLVFAEPTDFPYPSTWLIRGMTMSFPPDLPFQDLTTVMLDIPESAREGVRVRTIMEYISALNLGNFRVNPRDDDDPKYVEAVGPFYGQAK